MRVDTGETAGPRRAANWDVAVRLSEGDTRLAKPFHVGRFGLGVAVEAFDIVIEVITEDQEDVWLFGF